MPNRPSRIEISIPVASFDGRFRGRYPNGNAPPTAIASAAASSSSAAAALTTSGGGGEPTWLSGIANKQFVAPVSNWLGASGVKDPLADICTNSGPGSILRTYCGVAADRSNGKIRLLANGGHNDHYCNEVYFLDLFANAPAWKRERDATDSRIGANSNTSINHAVWESDGRPCAHHTYDMTEGGGGKWIGWGWAGLNYPGGTDDTKVWEWVANNPGVVDNANNDWVNRSALCNIGGSTNSGNQFGKYDPGTNRWYVVIGGNASPMIVVLDGTTLATVARNTSASLNDGCPEINGAIDTTHGILLLHGTDGTGSSEWRWIKLSNAATGSFGTLTPGTDISTTNGFDYEPVNDCFVTYNDAHGLVKLKATVSGGNYTALTGWTPVSGVTGAAPPAVDGAGLFGKAKVIYNMGAGRSLFCYLPAYQNPDMYCMPLGAGSL